ncbi:hypothetical protein [Streptomyces sp. W1SF4]|uniref:hypothetical protein n=1 Tax=Streptomyces sp. W1SF4 TaxID=2305220 RepID=UPI000F6D20AF|nr:hypothetical protein [Streptomyces sp. W1SF4]AZM91473.1 hypothetical protein D1J60_25810 [Streptomyces sp. W1SF4]
MTNQPPVTGPILIGVERIPAGATLDLGAFTSLVVSDVIDALLDPDGALWDLLHEVADPPKRAEDDDERLDREELERLLVERASSKVPLYGPAAARLARRLLAVAPPSVPQQRGEAA